VVIFTTQGGIEQNAKVEA